MQNTKFDVCYNKENDPENFFREKLFLYHPWRDETSDFLGENGIYEVSFVKGTVDAIERHYNKLDAVLIEDIANA